MAGHTQDATTVRFGPFELNLRTCCLTRRGEQERLALQPTRLLAVLVQRRGELVTREELHSQLWPGDTFGDFDHGLNNAVNRLREALGDSAATPRYIQTAPRRGYRFIAKVEFGVPDPVESAKTSRRCDPSLQITSIAVNPLRNTSGDASQDHFAESVTETLIGELAGNPQLKVFPGLAILNTGRVGEARFDILVEGSVIRLNNRLRITVQVVQLPDRMQIWSQRFDRSLGQILATLKEVAAAITAQIRADLRPRGEVQLNSALLVEPEAYDWYLRGRFYAQHQNKADNETAMLAFERAIAIDPTFALAYAELAQTYVWKLFLFAPHERQWQEKAFMSVEKALSLEPQLAVAYLARGRLLWTPANHFPHIRAIRDHRRAVALNPNLDEARNQLALIYCHIGYFDDALRESQEAALTNPNNHLAIYRTAQTLAFQGKYERALTVLHTIPREINPSLIGYQTAWVLFNLGKSGEASALIDQLLVAYPEDDGALFVSMQAVLAASAGEEAVAESKIQEAIRTGSGFGHFHHSAYHIAIAFTLMNKPEQALKCRFRVYGRISLLSVIRNGQQPGKPPSRFPLRRLHGKAPAAMAWFCGEPLDWSWCGKNRSQRRRCPLR